MQLPAREPEKPMRFHSRSELAIGVLLEQFIPNFELKTGQTFQVPIGYNKTCDFLINGVFFEYHPITLKYEFSHEKSFYRVAKILNKIPQKLETELREALQEEFATAYAKKRQFVLDATFGKGTELVVCGSPEAVHGDIIKRFSPNPPSQTTFLELFRCALKAEQLGGDPRRKSR